MRTAAVVALLIGAGTAGAQPRAVEAKLTADKNRVALSGTVRVTLTVDGPASMRGAVELPAQLLTADTDPNWRVRPEGAAEVTPLPDGRERWRRVFRLDPYLPGKPLRAAFASVGVHGKPLPDELAVEVTVERTGGDDAPLPDPLPVTAVEDPPPAPPDGGTDGGSVTAAVAAAVTLVCAALVAWGCLRARRARPVPPGAWARAALAGIEPGAAAAAERVAEVLRRYVERRFGVPAPRLTTGELHAELGARGWGHVDAESLRVLLEACDRAKFAGEGLDPDAGARLVAGAGAWVNAVDAPPA